VGRIPEQVVEEVRQRADIVSMVSRFVTLRQQGVRHWGLCPFHSEKTPSFQVHEEKQIFHCFGCGAGGDIFAFRMRHDGLSFPEVVRKLATEVGVEVPRTGSETEGRVAAIYRVNDATREFFREALRSREGAPARAYLEERGVPQDLVDRFQIGYAPAGWDGLCDHLERAGVQRSLAEQAGLVIPRQSGDGHYDRFRSRVVFPIGDPNGDIAGFGGRGLGDVTPKYMNSPESPAYRKSRVLFGLPQALDAIRRTKRAVIVEGYFDVLALHRAGIEEAVAPCGTALTPDHTRRLRRYTAEVVLLFDGDEAGQRAAERALPVLLSEGIRVRAAFLPAGQDPDTLLEDAGPEALRACIAGAEDLVDHLIEQRLRGASQSAWAAADAANAVAPLLRAVSDPIERADYVRRLAGRLDLPTSALEKAIAGRPSAPARDHTPAEERSGPVEIDPVSRALLAAISAFPELTLEVEPARLGSLEPGPGREILECLLSRARERGPAGFDRLVSPGGVELRPELVTVLSRLAAETDAMSRVEAEQALKDCQAFLERRARKHESKRLSARLDASRDPSEVTSLLEEKQRMLEEQRALR
jgi:DNA primase